MTTSVLVIDDDELFCQSLTDNLSDAGYSVRAVHTGEAGVQEFARLPSDIVMVDIIMPGKMEGVETMIEISEISPDVPIVAMSGGGTGDPEGYLASAAALGAADTLAKPFERDDLLAKLKQVMADRG